MGCNYLSLPLIPDSGTTLLSYVVGLERMPKIHLPRSHTRKTILRFAHYSAIIMSAMASQITSVLSIYSHVCSGVDQRKHQSSASLAFVRGIHRWPVNSLHKGPVTREMFPFDDVIMEITSDLVDKHSPYTAKGRFTIGPSDSKSGRYFSNHMSSVDWNWLSNVQSFQNLAKNATV